MASTSASTSSDHGDGPGREGIDRLLARTPRSCRRCCSRPGSSTRWAGCARFTDGLRHDSRPWPPSCRRPTGPGCAWCWATTSAPSTSPRSVTRRAGLLRSTTWHPGARRADWATRNGAEVLGRRETSGHGDGRKLADRWWSTATRGRHRCDARRRRARRRAARRTPVTDRSTGGRADGYGPPTSGLERPDDLFPLIAAERVRLAAGSTTWTMPSGSPVVCAGGASTSWPPPPQRPLEVSVPAMLFRVARAGASTAASTGWAVGWPTASTRRPPWPASATTPTPVSSPAGSGPRRRSRRHRHGIRHARPTDAPWTSTRWRWPLLEFLPRPGQGYVPRGLTDGLPSRPPT